jgi:putative methionine-R-sulfoxide reductase with GAF domain
MNVERQAAMKAIAAVIRLSGGYRWVGLYDVDHTRGRVVNVAWDGPGPPAFPVFPLTDGLTAAAIAEGRTVNVGDVAADSRYLTALGSTRSEIIVPTFRRGEVAGTLDVESGDPHAFSPAAQKSLEACAAAISGLWL